MVQIIRRQDPLGDLPGIFQQAFQSAIQQAELEKQKAEDREFQINMLMTRDEMARERMKEGWEHETDQWNREEDFKKMQSEKNWIGEAMMKGLVPGAEDDEETLTGPYGKQWKLPEGAEIPAQFKNDFFLMGGTRPGERPQVIRKPQPRGWQPGTKEEYLEVHRPKTGETYGPKTWDERTKSYLQQSLTTGKWHTFGKAPGDPSKTAPPEVAKAQSLIMKFVGGIDAQMAMMLTLNPELMGNPEIMNQIKGKVPPNLQSAYDNAIKILTAYYATMAGEHFIYDRNSGQLQKVSP